VPGLLKSWPQEVAIEAKCKRCPHPWNRKDNFPKWPLGVGVPGARMEKEGEDWGPQGQKGAGRGSVGKVKGEGQKGRGKGRKPYRV